MTLLYVDIGAVKIDETTNALMVQAKGLPGADDRDVQEFGFVPVWSTLGLTSAPGEGTQGILDDEAMAIVGFRNVKIASIYGQMKPGDTAVHSTGPGNVARTFWKQATREVTTLVKDPQGKDAYFSLNGTEEKFQINIGGWGFEIGKDGFKVMGPSGFYQLTPDGMHYQVGKTVVQGQAPKGAAVTSGGPSTSVIA